MMFATAAGAPQAAQAAIAPTATIEVATSTVAASPDMEQIVRKYFADTPELAEVARCESTFVQFEKNGEIRRGKQNPDDIGVMQINEYYHAKTAKKLGDDLYTLEGNMAYAKYLYEKNGLSDWEASKPCWEKPVSKLLAKAN